MADANYAVRQGALDGLAALAVPVINVGASVSESTPRTQVLLRGNAGELARELLGVVLPSAPRATASSDAGHALWLGPDEWLLIADPSLALPTHVPVDAAMVDLSDTYTAIRVSGANACDVLAKSISLDLRLSVYPAGNVVRTKFARIQAIVHRRQEHTFDVLVTRSFARYAWAWLNDAAAEYA